MFFCIMENFDDVKILLHDKYISFSYKFCEIFTKTCQKVCLKNVGIFYFCYRQKHGRRQKLYCQSVKKLLKLFKKWILVEVSINISLFQMQNSYNLVALDTWQYVKCILNVKINSLNLNALLMTYANVFTPILRKISFI